MRPTAAIAGEPQNTIVFLVCVHMECQKVLELFETLPRRNKNKNPNEAQNMSPSYFAPCLSEVQTTSNNLALPTDRQGDMLSNAVFR